MNTFVKHSERLFGGIGLITIVYVILKMCESKPAIIFLLAYPVLGYAVGWFVYSEIEK